MVLLNPQRQFYVDPLTLAISGRFPILGQMSKSQALLGKTSRAKARAARADVPVQGEVHLQGFTDPGFTDPAQGRPRHKNMKIESWYF